MEEMRSLEDLLELQRLDSAIDRLLERRNGLSALARFRTAHVRLEKLASAIGEAESRLRDLSLAEDRVEGEMGFDEDKLKREESRLYAGGLSARDATHLRDEVEMLRKRISTREDEALALLERQQSESASLEQMTSERDRITVEKSQLETEIGAAWKEIDADIARLEAEKAVLVPTIDPELIALYEEIRPSKEGVAAAALVERTCSGCHLRLSAAEEVQVLKEEPPRCIHCRRILVSR